MMGTQLVILDILYLDGGFVKGEEFDIRVTGEQTFVGESSNTITAVTPKGNAKKETIQLSWFLEF